MKITLESQSSIESIRKVLAGLYSGQFEVAMSVAEALLERVTTEVRQQQPPIVIPSVDCGGCDRSIDAFEQEEAGLTKHKKLAAKLNKEMHVVEEYVRGELQDIDYMYWKVEEEQYRKEQLLRESDSLPY